MAEEIVLGKLVLDTSDLQNSMAQSKKAIIDLENEQKNLKKETDNLSGANEQQLQSFVDNEAQLKKMKSEYAANQKSVLDLAKAQTGLDSALAQNVKTQNEAIANTKALTEARKQIDTTTVDGAKAIADINAKITANNKLVNENSSALEQQKNNVGNYPQIIGNVGNAFGGATQKAIGFVQQGKEIVGALGAVNNAVVTSAKGVIGFGNASNAAAVQAAEMATVNTTAATATEGLAVAEGTATAATGALNVVMGILLAPVTLIVAAIGALIFLFKDLDPLVDKIEQGFAALTAVVDVLRQSLLAILSLDFSGFDDLGGKMSRAATEAANLKEAQQDLEDAQKSQAVTNAKASQQYDELILKSKNRTLTEKQRIAFLNQAQAIEEANFKQRSALAQAELDNAVQAAKIKGQLSEQELANLKKNTVAYANYLLNTGRISDEQRDKIIEAEKGKIEIRAESTRRLEKSQNAEDKLAEDAEKKAADRAEKQKAASDKALQAEIKNSQNRIDILKAESAQRTLSTEEQINNLQKVFELQNQLAKKTLEGSDQTKQLIANRQELSSAILALTDEQISKEIEAQKKASESKKALTELELLNAKDDAEFLAQAQIALLNKRLLSEKAYADEVAKINLAKNESITAANLTFAETEKVRLETAALNAKALDEIAFQTRLVDIEAQNATEAEIKEALLAENYAREKELLEQSLKDKTISNDVYLAKLGLANKKYNADTAKNDKILAKQKEAQAVGMLNTGLDALGQLFEGSKAIAVAQALVNTYQGISAGVALGYPMAIPAVAFAALSGFAAVKNILKTTKTSTSADTEGSKPAVTSGAGAFVNTAQTETIARATERPTDTQPIAPPPVLILESLHEAQNNLAIKIQS